MLRSLKDLETYRIQAADGEVGGVKDLLFDDREWRVRYLVASAGEWLSGRKVLLATAAFGTPDWDTRRFVVPATKEQIRNSPGLDTDPPVTRQHELDLHRHYKWLPYWSTAPTKGFDDRAPRDPNLRSVRQVLGYAVEATDGSIGKIEDFIVDDSDWTIRYVVVDTRNWWPGKHVLVSPEWIARVDWYESKVHVDLARGAIKNSPEYDAARPLDREYEAQLYDAYRRPRYWDRSDAA